MRADIRSGSGLAREGGLSVGPFSDCHTAFASKPAPTGDCIPKAECGHLGELLSFSEAAKAMAWLAGGFFKLVLGGCKVGKHVQVNVTAQVSIKAPWVL